MSNYFVELPGSMSLIKLGKAIEGEEALGTQFVASRLWVNDKSVISNLAEFAELDTKPNSPLNAPRVVTTIAEGDHPGWAGAMVVGGTANHMVYLLRAK